jgi:hypothetical protein
MIGGILKNLGLLQQNKRIKELVWCFCYLTPTLICELNLADWGDICTFEVNNQLAIDKKQK